VSEHANHTDNLPAMHDGMVEHMPQDFPARKTSLNVAGKLQIQLDSQTILGLVFKPSAVAVPEWRPPLPEGVDSIFRSHARWQPPGSPVRSRAQTVLPDSFAIVNMAESGKNIGVRDAEIALHLLGRESGATLEQIQIGPRAAADIGLEQLLNEGHGKSIYGGVTCAEASS